MNIQTTNNMMNLQAVNDAFNHMSSPDPLRIQNPDLEQSGRSLGFPGKNISFMFGDNSVRVSFKDESFDLMYNNRSEAELASELVDIVDYLETL